MFQYLKNKYVLSLIFATALIFIGIAISANRDRATFVDNTVGNVMSPVQKVFFNIGSKIEDFVQFVAEIRTLSQENEKLRQEIEILREENRKLEPLKEENQRLREMIGLKDQFEQFNVVGAQIIAKGPGNWFSTFTIDKGTNDGLNKNDVAITNQGVVGHIFEIGTNWAKVVSIIDANGAVSGLVMRTRDIAMVKGDVVLQNEGLCKMVQIPNDADVIVNDKIETSGLGGIYPKGLLIGTIIDIKQEAHEISKYAVVKPSVDFKRLEEVLIITKR